MIPTLADVIAEIETGPLARQCAKHWATVFEAPSEAKPVERELIGSWEVKTRRAGRIHPDAAFHIHRILAPRAVELGWTEFTPKTVKYAKAEASSR